jgi:NADPH:quinone reductase-like Zn-dependent oxidoreductase
MRVIQFGQYGAPDVLQIAERDTPVPGAGQVQVRVKAAGLNPADVKWRDGLFRDLMPLTLPHVVGYDVAGIVTALGPDVTRFKMGDRIVASVQSGYADFAVADQKACTLLPASFDFVLAAALPCAALTGVQLIEDGIRPQPGQIVLVTGATGAVGRFAVKAARDLGARVVAAVRPAYAGEALALGAEQIVPLGEPANEDLLFDHVADTVGGPDVAGLCRHVKPGGLIRTVATTPIDPTGLPSQPAFFGFHPDGDRLARIVRDVASGVIAMPVARRLPLTEAAEAHRLFERGGVGGKIVLEP